MNADYKTKTDKPVEALISKAANSEDSADAMRFAQAAQNAANAMSLLVNLSPPVRPAE